MQYMYIKTTDMIETCLLKGIVARGLFGLGFFHRAVPLGLLDIRKNDLAEISILAEIFVFEGCLALSASPLRKF